MNGYEIGDFSLMTFFSKVYAKISSLLITDVRNTKITTLINFFGKRDITKGILVRVDDYPRTDLPFELFVKFHRIMMEQGVTYLLSVTPYEQFFRRQSKVDFARYFDFLAEENITFGIHGFTHNVDELKRADRQGLEDKICRVFELFSDHPGLLPVYIPPFNDIRMDEYLLLRRHFKIITGGPESIKTLGLVPTCMLKGVLYLPSYWGCYGGSGDVLNYLSRLRERKIRLTMPVTLHWAWEAQDDFGQLQHLLSFMRHDVANWRDVVYEAE